MAPTLRAFYVRVAWCDCFVWINIKLQCWWPACGGYIIYVLSGCCLIHEKGVDMYETNASGEIYHTRKRIRNSKFGEMNHLLYQWYRKAVSRNIYPDGPLLKEKAK